MNEKNAKTMPAAKVLAGPAADKMNGTDDIINAKLTHLNYIKNRPMSEGERLFYKIGVGKENAVKSNNREFRALISEACTFGMLIINDMDGKGYYIPDLNNPDEIAAAERYVESEIHRADIIMNKAEIMSDTLMKAISA